MSDKYYCVEAAKTGRSKCLYCKKGIGESELRLGESNDEKGTLTRWLHLYCVTQYLDAAPETSIITGFDGLSSTDKKTVEKELSSSGKRITTKPPPKKKAAPVKKKVVTKDESSESDESGSDPSESESEEGSSEKTKKRKKAPAKTKSPVSKKFKHDAATLKKIEQYRDELGDKKVDELKEMLRSNDQALKGTKSELIAKVADGMALGRIPRCPKCFGGRLRFENGKYICPGYGDDEGKYHRCTFKSADVKREEWVGST